MEGSAESKGWSVGSWPVGQDERVGPQPLSHSGWGLGRSEGRKGQVRAGLVAAQEGLAVGCSEVWTTTHSQTRQGAKGREFRRVPCGAQTPGPGPGTSWEEDSDGASWEQACRPSILLGPALVLLKTDW